MNAKKTVLGHIFPNISGSIGLIVLNKNMVHPCVDSYQPCNFHENRFKTVTCIVTVIIIISWKSRSAIFYCKLKNIHEVLLLESILIWKEILWRINFVLIKFSLNVLLFEKSWNECKNPSFLHKAMCIESNQSSMKMRLCLSTFMAWYF